MRRNESLRFSEAAGKKSDFFISRVFWIFAAGSVFLFSLFLISAEPPEPHAIQGYIFHSNGITQVPSGTIVRINATLTGSFVEIRTSGPPGHSGFYSANIYAINDENVTVTSFNATMFGRNSTVLLASPSVTRLNITLNTTRPAETDVNILFPGNNSMFDKYKTFSVTFNVSAIGGQDSFGCNVTISFGDEAVFNVTSGTNATRNLGDINLGENRSGYFEVEALNEGLTTVSIIVMCVSDAENFEGLSSKTINLRVAQQAPQLHAIQGYVFHSDGTTQVPSGTNVTINATFTGSVVRIKTSGPPGHSGFYSTMISARDGEFVIVSAENESYKGNNTGYFLDSPGVTRVNVTLNFSKSGPPTFFDVLVEDDLDSPADEIDLTVAGNKTVNCSAIMTDSEGFGDLQSLIAVFFDSSEANATSSDDNNNHYTNESCVLSNCDSLSCEVDCLFEVEYYANANSSNSWTCILNATDSAGSGYGSDTTSINTLLAIEFPDSLNFGIVSPNSVSDEIVGNITNRGNVKIDISVEGYGGEDGDGYAMVCDDGKNISIGYEKYNLTESNFGVLDLETFEMFYKNLTDSPVNETELNLDYRKNDAFDDAINQSYWRIFFPPGSSEGVSCSGQIVISVLQDV